LVLCEFKFIVRRAVLAPKQVVCHESGGELAGTSTTAEMFPAKPAPTGNKFVFMTPLYPREP
jgi:hypothetical protein